MEPSGRVAPTFLVLALSAALAAGCSRADSGPAEGAAPLFTRVPSTATGVTFANLLEEDPVMNGFTYEYYYNGGGVAVGDLNGDDLPDLYFTGNRVPNRLYLNRGGMRFEDVSEAAGVRGHTGWATGVAFTDVNGDGRLDIHVSYSGVYADADLRRNQLFVNRGAPTPGGVPAFVDEAEAWGLADRGMSTQAAFFDQDGDGDLDAYLMNHGVAGFQGRVEDTARALPYMSDRLYRNEDGRFVDVSAEAGVMRTNLGFGLGLSVGDLNDDGRPDLYVANDYAGRDHFYLGGPGGRLREVLETAMPHIPYAAMGSDLGDMDGDGRLDLVVVEMAMDNHYDRVMSSSGIDGGGFAALVREGQHYQYESNALQWNRGVGPHGVPRFSDVAYLAGVARTDWSWAPLFADLDNDGRPDLFITTGTPSDMIHRDFRAYRELRVEEVVEAEGRVTHSLMEELLGSLPRRQVPNRAFRNEGDLGFRDRTDAWGLGAPSFSNGAVYADLDRDGDLDLVVNELMGEASVWRNETQERSGGAGWLAVALRGPAGNPFGVGARVRLRVGGMQQLQEMQLTRGYQSSVEPILHFGLGTAAAADTLEVRWPDGSVEVRTGVQGGARVTLAHGDARPASRPDAPRPLFVPADAMLRPPARHGGPVPRPESSRATYPAEREPLALAVGDVDGDGRDDFVLGGAGDEPDRLWLQASDGGFRPAGAGALPAPPAGTGATVAAALLDADGDGRADLWLAHAPAGDRPGPWRHRLLLGLGGGRFRAADAGAVPEVDDAGFVVAAGDFDGDGDPDVFVGGHAPPGSVRAASSRLLRNDGGRFTDVTAEAAPGLRALTTATDAAWADVDGDGALDLVVAGEWGPIRIWRGGSGTLREATAEMGLEGLEGWWQSVVPADVDGDGDTDLVAGNLGLNFPYRPTPDRPFEVYVADFDGDGREEPVPAYRPSGRLQPWLERDDMAALVPSLAERYPTHHLFARSMLPDVLGQEALDAARRFGVSELASMVLLNDGGGRFTARVLPAAAQVSAVMGAVAADFDGDGRVDLAVAGNLWALGPPTPRADGGVGLLLVGDGAGGFAPVAAGASGLLLDGPVRRLAAVARGDDGPPGLLAAVVGGEVRYLLPDGDEGRPVLAAGRAGGDR